MVQVVPKCYDGEPSGQAKQQQRGIQGGLGGSRIAAWKDRQELFRRSWKDRKRQPGQDRERHTKPGMIIHTWNPRWAWRWRQKDQEGKANLGNTATGNSV